MSALGRKTKLSALIAQLNCSSFRTRTVAVEEGDAGEINSNITTWAARRTLHNNALNAHIASRIVSKPKGTDSGVYTQLTQTKTNKT